MGVPSGLSLVCRAIGPSPARGAGCTSLGGGSADAVAVKDPLDLGLLDAAPGLLGPGRELDEGQLTPPHERVNLVLAESEQFTGSFHRVQQRLGGGCGCFHREQSTRTYAHVP